MSQVSRVTRHIGDTNNKSGVIKYDGKGFSIVDVFLNGMRGIDDKGYRQYMVGRSIFVGLSRTHLLSSPRFLQFQTTWRMFSVNCR